MSEFTPSVYQQKIYDWFQSGSGCIAVSAVAGSGKTTTIVQGLHQAPQSIHFNSSHVLFAAFNKSIVEELLRRLPAGVDCRTIHSLGYATLRNGMRNTPKLEVDDAKYKIIAKRLNLDSSYGDPHVFRDAALSLLRFAQATLCPIDSESLADIADRFNVEVPPCGIEPLAETVSLFLKEGISQTEKTGKTSYGDMVWMPGFLGMQPATYGLVCVDEAQDLSKAQMTLIQRAANGSGRVIAVGDPRQAIYCQPKGTMVLAGERIEGGKHVTGYRTVPIEEIAVGDTVVAYAREDAAFYKGKAVLAAGSRKYTGDLFKVAVLESETECTDNHRWIVRWTERSIDLNVTYLMRRGNRFRVGWCQLFGKDDDGHGCLHLGQRARIERADAVWILGVHRDKTSASLHESEIALRYQLPTIPFTAVNGAQHLTQGAIDRFFDLIEDVNLQTNAENCLKDFARSIDWPFYQPDNAKRGRTTLFEVRACNLLSGGLMKVPVWTGKTKNPEWEQVTVTSERVYNLEVHSLEIDKYHTYVANGIVTGNSFAGAESDSFHQIVRHFDAQQLPLSICYRCPSSVIAEARKIVPQIECAPGAEPGIVDTISDKKFREMIASGDMVLCRTTAPLIKLCFELIGQRKQARIKGRDVAASLVNAVKQICNRQPFESFSVLLQGYRMKQLEVLEQKIGSESQQEVLNDRCDALEVCYQSFQPVTKEGFISDIESLFSDQRAAITLSTVHRAKGLENPRVFILHPEKLPLIWKGQTPEQNRQEWNLRYVAVTRAQQELYFVSDCIQEKE